MRDRKLQGRVVYAHHSLLVTGSLLGIQYNRPRNEYFVIVKVDTGDSGTAFPWPASIHYYVRGFWGSAYISTDPPRNEHFLSFPLCTVMNGIPTSKLFMFPGGISALNAKVGFQQTYSYPPWYPHGRKTIPYFITQVVENNIAMV